MVSDDLRERLKTALVAKRIHCCEDCDLAEDSLEIAAIALEWASENLISHCDSIGLVVACDDLSEQAKKLREGK